VLLFSIIGCGSSRKVVKTTVTDKEINKEIVIKQSPYKLSATTDLKFDSSGVVKPVSLKLNFGKTKADLLIRDNQVTYTLENKDTITIDRKIERIKVTETVKEDVEVVKEKKLGFFGRIKDKFNSFFKTIAWISIIINLLFIAVKLSRSASKLYVPF
jgi:hypothetical protein